MKSTENYIFSMRFSNSSCFVYTGIKEICSPNLPMPYLGSSTHDYVVFDFKHYANFNSLDFNDIVFDALLDFILHSIVRIKN